jgi:hypothetical protein
VGRSAYLSRRSVCFFSAPAKIFEMLLLACWERVGQAGFAAGTMGGKVGRGLSRICSKG